MKLTAGRRVYVPSKQIFGTVVREGGILGLKTSYAVVDDLGKKMVFVGDDIEFVYVDSSEDLNGNKVEIPSEDVVPQIQNEYSPHEARKMTIDLYEMSPEERGKACEKILKSKKTATAKKASSKKSSSKRTSKRTSLKKSTS